MLEIGTHVIRPILKCDPIFAGHLWTRVFIYQGCIRAMRFDDLCVKNALRCVKNALKRIDSKFNDFQSAH